MTISYRSVFPVVAVAGLAALLALNLSAQRQTNQRLDALTATLAERQQPAPITAPPTGAVPRELDKVSLPPYVIEAPDVLTIEVVLKDPETGATTGLRPQPISGSFIVRPDGTVGLGAYGTVYVSGLTIEQAVAAIRKQLAKFDSPELSAEKLVVIADVLAFNSKVYYVITDSANDGQQVARLPLTGNETVIDAVASIGAADTVGKKSMRVVRKSPTGTEQVLPIDWTAITKHGVTTTNYQLLSGDRLYVTKTVD